MRVFLITESCFHVSYLINALFGKNEKPCEIILRQKNKLNPLELSIVHDQLVGKKELTADEIVMLENAYQHKLSRAELALITVHGVPKFHVLSFPVAYTVTALNSAELLNTLQAESQHTKLAAVIFLDCILNKRWIEIFQQRIVNAHSAILPRARGMYAIEQIATMGDAGKLKDCAGASIHYIDEKVDIGLLIKTQQLDDIWQHDDIWQVKAASYMTAFQLLTDYLADPNAFSLTDGFPYTEALGPEFKAKEFTKEVAEKAAELFNEMQRAQTSYKLCRA